MDTNKHLIAVVTVSSKGQITIPASVRNEEGITGGTKINLYRNEDNELVLHVKRPEPSTFWQQVLAANKKFGKQDLVNDWIDFGEDVRAEKDI
ncbi:hypothetical protein BVJ53_11655 [Lacticaseibacillus chiayiensis]|uniref:AbrB/MazE/SpoVT family DNA-binding domain-containing protein n=1 Tax=Lacticaseibacillus chiayiensis TaxID=2100821 RepID=A0A4Q1TKK0_9LACO|nr:AbrB/MazE/SpoVT family DNA-binding domain-containing protein [Lacticaseibacillus chiayiensis]QVI33828.1 AbrB/MazE/SpoVT family DNA-binding domain-containing protein [Lacticaseibacillus chiayiensis]RXT19119.1 hypothetical protein BVJ53_11655 [Lacticaseibacillus chiayiensis]RXT54363.1 hypothetical protein CHT97_13355 [Lacticaseibacillus chiayiensis]UYN55575.1 AbrB/MazE/SpoVT family DNA-binding domain-containing protein [Lacticaseibacillus chiayiensis]